MKLTEIQQFKESKAIQKLIAFYKKEQKIINIKKLIL
jgi:hypothetical protein